MAAFGQGSAKVWSLSIDTLFTALARSLSHIDLADQRHGARNGVLIHRDRSMIENSKPVSDTRNWFCAPSLTLPQQELDEAKRSPRCCNSNLILTLAPDRLAGCTGSFTQFQPCIRVLKMARGTRAAFQEGLRGNQALGSEH
jgi:hypothetical protein